MKPAQKKIQFDGNVVKLCRKFQITQVCIDMN